MTIKDLKPALVFQIFDEITKVPRPSKKEEKIRQFLLDFAAKHNLAVKTDAIGNVVITKPATPGKEDAPTVIMQSHMDMVCESNDKSLYFFASSFVDMPFLYCSKICSFLKRRLSLVPVAEPHFLLHSFFLGT